VKFRLVLTPLINHFFFQDSFEFAWDLIVTLYRNGNRLDIENVWLKIKDFEFNAAVELEKKMEIVMIAKNLFGAANVTF